LAIEADSAQYLTVLKLVLWDETLSPWISYIFTKYEHFSTTIEVSFSPCIIVKGNEDVAQKTYKLSLNVGLTYDRFIL
jgi:hypothetical protein